MLVDVYSIAQLVLDILNTDSNATLYDNYCVNETSGIAHRY